MIEQLLDSLLGIRAPLAYLLVFLFAFAEGPLLLGFIVPGEVAVIIGGALVRFGNASFLPMAIAAALGAILGDTVGFWMGRWIGPWFLKTRLGKWLEEKRFAKARRYLKEKGAKAVILGRFTAALRVLIPGLCGLSEMRYSRFLPANALGGAAWGASMVAAGYAAGAAWEQAQRWVGAASVLLLAAIVALWAAAAWFRRRRRRRHPSG